MAVWASLQSVAIQSDDKVIIGGFFTSYNGTARSRIARLNSDGSLDTSFNIGSGANNSVQVVATQSDNKVLLVGQFTSVDTTARTRIARLEGIAKAATSLSLASSSNPAQFGQSVTFTATVTPQAASGVVTFSFDGTGLITTTSPVISGVATYVTNTLAIGTYTVTATYGGDSNYLSSTSSPPYAQVIVAACNPQVVTSSQDDGQATTCGTFSFALATTSSGIISFALTSGGNTITFSGSLTPTLKAGVAIDGGANGVILNGNGVAGNGLRLGGGNTITNLTIKSFAGQELLATVSSAANRLFKVKVQN